jgi:hypothetical protein
MYKYSFRIPPYYTLLVRSLSVLEGIALASDPNYKVGGVGGGGGGGVEGLLFARGHRGVGWKGSCLSKSKVGEKEGGR